MYCSRILKEKQYYLNLVNGQYYGLDKNSHHMYQVLVTSPSIQAAYEVLSNEYEIELEQLKVDLEKFLKHLLENGLIIYTNPPV